MKLNFIVNELIKFKWLIVTSVTTHYQIIKLSLSNAIIAILCGALMEIAQELWVAPSILGIMELHV